MTETELNKLGQMIQRLMSKGTAWILVVVPPNNCTGHPDCDCQVQTVTNLMDEEQAGAILDGVAGMYEHGTYEETFTRAIEKMN
jgi:hypothetical protein